MIPIRDLNPTRSTPWVTWSVILLCGLVYLWQMVLPPGADRAFVDGWGLVPSRLTHLRDVVDLATVFTSMFMHGGLMHVAGNLWFLHIFGDNVEDNMGPVRFAAFYLLVGVAAAAAQVMVSPESNIPMVGASGAIAGVLAAYLVLFPRARVVALIPAWVIVQMAELPALLFIAIWFALQFFAGVGALGGSGGGVAYWAHIGGFVAGLVLVFVFRRPQAVPEQVSYRRPQPRARPWDDENW